MWKSWLLSFEVNKINKKEEQQQLVFTSNAVARKEHYLIFFERQPSWRIMTKDNWKAAMFQNKPKLFWSHVVLWKIPGIGEPSKCIPWRLRDEVPRGCSSQPQAWVSTGGLCEFSSHFCLGRCSWARGSWSNSGGQPCWEDYFYACLNSS